MKTRSPPKPPYSVGYTDKDRALRLGMAYLKGRYDKVTQHHVSNVEALFNTAEEADLYRAGRSYDPDR